jgi:hypothetical protein
MSLIKAIFLGGFLTWLISLILGKNHQDGGYLSVHTMIISHYSVYWSWPLFLVATLLAWAILTMMPSDR